jgi:hypothetical protein
MARLTGTDLLGKRYRIERVSLQIIKQGIHNSRHLCFTATVHCTELAVQCTARKDDYSKLLVVVG